MPIDHLCFRVALALTLAFALPRLNAQMGGTGSIQGTITDPSGAAVPTATVTATNVATNAKTVQQTTETGFYSIAALPAGQYTVNVTATGFQSVTQEKVLVDALATITVNLSLQVGSVGETVTVSSAPRR